MRMHWFAVHKKECFAYTKQIAKAWLCVYLFTHCLFQPVYVEGSSMAPNIEAGTIGLSNVATRYLKGIHRFDIVLLKHQDEIWVKRVIGLPEDCIEVKQHQLYINGQQMEEPYLASDTQTEDFGQICVPQGEVFVLGDHREASYDSRTVKGIKLSSIISKDLYILQ